MAVNKLKDGFILFLCLEPALYRQADIGAVERGYEGARFDKMQLANNISAGDFICGGSQSNNRHLRKLPVEYSHLSVFRAKVVSPLRNTVGFINSEQRNMHISQ